MKYKWLIGPVLALALGHAQQLYVQRCAVCHGDNAAGSDRGPALARSRHLRGRSASQIRDIIRNGTPAGMPAFALPENELQELARFVRSMNATAFDARPEGDGAAGERFFFGQGRCAGCHTAAGRGKSIGPDLANIGRETTVGELERKLADPAAPVSAGYAMVTVRLRQGRTVRGFARKETLHALQLQTTDGALLLLGDGEYEIVSRDKAPHESVPPAARARPARLFEPAGWRRDRPPAGPGRSDSGGGHR